jgi:hypothetical protein
MHRKIRALTRLAGLPVAVGVNKAVLERIMGSQSARPKIGVEGNKQLARRDSPGAGKCL